MPPLTPEPLFACDAMLGGLARWLRATGYDASWRCDITDPDLIALAGTEGRILLSSDTGIFQRRPVRDGHLSSVQIPNGLSVPEQVEFVLRRLRLPLREPRCMVCGGVLNEVPREQAKAHVPPRSFAWLQHFYACSRCGQFFWHGTHWQRIVEQLRQKKG